MKSEMTAVEFCHAHGHTFVRWLKSNTVECACEQKYACDETTRHGVITIDAEKEILCRRCFVPIGLHPVSLRAPIPGPAPPAPLPAADAAAVLPDARAPQAASPPAVFPQWRGFLGSPSRAAPSRVPPAALPRAALPRAALPRAALPQAALPEPRCPEPRSPSRAA